MIPTDRNDGRSKPARSSLSNLQLRVISAVVLAAVALAATFAGDLAFRLLAAGIAALIFYEWAAMSRAPANARLQDAGGVLLAVVLLALVSGVAAGVVLLSIAVGAAALLAVGMLFGRGRSAAVGFAYAGLSGGALAFLRGGDVAGFAAIIFLFAVVWATDICAYFIGRAIGGPKLAPSISPGKTWSGGIGGAIAGVAAGLAAAAALDQPVGWTVAMIALLLSIVSQAGDLFESAAKRRYGVKDSGSLIPGHGGVMDRVDGLVAAAIALYAIGAMIAGADNPALGVFPG